MTMTKEAALGEPEMPDLGEAVDRWQSAADEATLLRYEAETLYAQALLTSQGKAKEQREAEADLAAMDLRRRAEYAHNCAQARRYVVEFLVKTAGRLA